MIAYLAGLAMGLSTGITGTALVALLLARCDSEPIAPAPDADDDATEVLMTHQQSRAQQLRGYADHLAAGDGLLRERLRRFERGAR